MERAPSEGECVAFIVSCFAGLHPAHAQRVLRSCAGDVTAAVEHYQSLLCAQDIAHSEGRPFSELDGSGLSTAEVARAAASRGAAKDDDDDDDDDEGEELSPEDERTLCEFIRTVSDMRAAEPAASQPPGSAAAAWAATADEMATEEDAEGEGTDDTVDDTTLSQLVELFPQFAFGHIRSVLVQHSGDFDAAVDELTELDRAADAECAKDAALTTTPVSLAAGASIVAWKKHTPQHSPAPPLPSHQQQPGKKQKLQIIGRSARFKRLGSMYGQYIGEDMIEEIFSASHERIDETEAALKNLFPDIYEKVAMEQQRQQQPQQPQGQQGKQQQQKKQQKKQGKAAKAATQKRKAKEKSKSGAKKDPHTPVPGTCIDARGRINAPPVQPRKKEAPNASIVRGQDYIDAQYKRRDECHRCASVAFCEGDHERVRKLLALAQECERRIRAVRENAVGDALVSAPNYVRENPIIDLHGFWPAEALAVLESTLLGPNDLAGTKLLVITGRGAHSRNHRAVVRPAVEKWLRDHGFSFRDVNGGSYEVFL